MGGIFGSGARALIGPWICWRKSMSRRVPEARTRESAETGSDEAPMAVTTTEKKEATGPTHQFFCRRCHSDTKKSRVMEGAI